MHRDPLPSVLEQGETADYVISSLVASQLAVRLKELFFSMYQEKFGEPIVANPRFMGAILPIYAQMSSHMPAKHSFDLSKWVGKEGRMYLSDTMSAFGGMFPLVPANAQSFFNKIMKPAGGGEPVTRQWKYSVSAMEVYEVKSYLR